MHVHIQPLPAQGDRAFEDLLAEMEATPEDAAGLSAARQRIGLAFYGGAPTLASLRLAAGFSQRQLGERCHMMQPNVSRFESGRHEPTLGVAHEMAAALGVDLDRFFEAWTNSRSANEAQP
jgi:DNA-binding XRE family transcriptional regulator